MQATRELLNKHLGVRVTNTELKCLEAFAKDKGLKKSDLARRIICKWMLDATQGKK